MSRQRAIMNWSGGKDSALALYYSLRADRWAIQTLLTSVNEQFGRVSMHGVRMELLTAQADRLGLPLTWLTLPGDVSMEEYDARMQTTLRTLTQQGSTYAIYGDIFLNDLRQYRENQLHQVHLSGAFPLWQRDTTELIHEFVDLGFRAVLVCVNDKQLSAEFIGRELNLDLLKDLPKTVDPCGENGEYHSFVYDGPIFSSPIPFTKGNIIHRTYAPSGGTDCHTDQTDSRWDTGFWYQDLLLSAERPRTDKQVDDPSNGRVTF